MPTVLKKKVIAKKPEVKKVVKKPELKAVKKSDIKTIVKKNAAKKEVEAKEAKTEQLQDENKEGMGHNGGPKYGGISGEQLRGYITRIEKLEEDKKALAEDIKEVFQESRANGFDNKIVRKIIALRKMDAAEREELETLIDLYKHALGMIPADSDNEDEDDDSSL
jgi:uncharacterized protein (UPF0335 family)